MPDLFHWCASSTCTTGSVLNRDFLFSLSLAVRAWAVPTPEEMSNLTPESSPE